MLLAHLAHRSDWSLFSAGAGPFHPSCFAGEYSLDMRMGNSLQEMKVNLVLNFPPTVP